MSYRLLRRAPICLLVLVLLTLAAIVAFIHAAAHRAAASGVSIPQDGQLRNANIHLTVLDNL